MVTNTESIRQSTIEDLNQSTTVVVSQIPGAPEQVHVFDDPGDRSRLAIKAALAAGRPLLVRGEPGVGKTQLAAAAAKALKRPLVPFTVDSRSESRDLLWEFDSVRRLAEAQICGTLGRTEDQVRDKLHSRRFIEPGPLWWGFNWDEAKRHCKEHQLDVLRHSSDVDPLNGRVVLIDEIDKADSDLPNGLLEALGAGRFHPRGMDHPIEMQSPSPLVIITTNEERVLPDAFIRRCLVLHLRLPEKDDELMRLLVARGKAHFKDVETSVLEMAARMLVDDRNSSPPPKPGQAEFFDLVRTVHESGLKGKEAELLMARIAEFTLKKHSGAG